MAIRMMADNQYALLYGTRLARGIPHFFDLCVRMLWDLRQTTQSGRGVPFAVVFLSTRNVEVPSTVFRKLPHRGFRTISFLE